MNEVPFSDAGPTVGIPTPDGASMESGDAVSVAAPPGASPTISQENSLATYLGSDYKPSKERQARLDATLRAVGEVKDTKEQSIIYGNGHVHVEITPDRDYLTPEETVKKSKIRETMIMEVARRIFESYSTQNKKYRRAQALLKDATEAAMENPSKELELALKCVERGIPMNKSRAILKARDQVMTQTQVD